MGRKIDQVPPILGKILSLMPVYTPMNDNLDELKGLVATIAADRQAQKDKEQRESWTKFVSLSVIFLAVFAAIATQRGAGYSSAVMKQLNEATFEQAQASDQWAYYQAKGIKINIHEQEHDRLVALGNADPKAIAAVTTKIDRYKKEQKDISVLAKGYEDKRDEARKAATLEQTRGREMGLSTTIFQIAIALGGMTLVMKKRWLWNASLLAGLLATVQMARVLFFLG
jgi:flagellar basal body-associated protein FliL